MHDEHSSDLPAELSLDAASQIAAELARENAARDRAIQDRSARPPAADPRVLQLSTQELIRLRASFTGWVGLLGLFFIGLFVIIVAWGLVIAIMSAIGNGGRFQWDAILFAAFFGLAPLVVGLGFLFLARPLGRRLIPFKPGRLRCPKCRYDLSALTAGRCPECGYQVDPPDPPATLSPSAAVQRVRLVVGAVMNIALVLGLLGFWIYQAMLRLGVATGSGSFGGRRGEPAINLGVVYYTTVGMVTLGLLLLISINAWLVRFIVPMEIVKPITHGALQKSEREAGTSAGTSQADRPKAPG